METLTNEACNRYTDTCYTCVCYSEYNSWRTLFQQKRKTHFHKIERRWEGTYESYWSESVSNLIGRIVNVAHDVGLLGGMSNPRLYHLIILIVSLQ